MIREFSLIEIQEVILAYIWENLNVMLTKIACLWPIKHTLLLLFSSCRVWLFVTPWAAARQASLSFTIPGVCSNSCPLSPWCHPTISASNAHFSSCPQSFPVSGSFLMGVFTSSDKNMRASAPASMVPMNIQGWFSSGLTGLISLQSKGFSRVFSNTTVR